MVASSKPILLDYSCYELGHTWTPSCRKASLDVAYLVAKEAFKIYGTLYFIAGLIRKRGKAYFMKKFWKELIQSTFFLTTNGTLFIACFCLWRKIAKFYFYPCAILIGVPACGISVSIERKERQIVGSFYYVNTLAFIPSLMASFVAILQERKSRRGLLAVYMANVAIETVWRMLKARGYVKALPNGEVLLFSIASAAYLYFFKMKNGLPDGTQSLLKALFGADEAPPKENICKEIGDQVIQRDARRLQITSETKNGLSHSKIVEWLKGCHQSHSLCRHKHSCIFYILKGSSRMFLLGYAAQAAIKLIGSIGKLFKQPSSVIKALLHSNNIQLGAFLASFVGIYRALNCLLRWLRDKDDSIHGMVSGFVAGWSLLFYKSQTIALYTAAKLAEMLYFKGIGLGVVPYIPCADIIIYSISTALVFHAAVLEPHNLRPAYWNFLLRVTGNKFALMNRRLLDPYLPSSSAINPTFWPDYDMRYTKLVKPVPYSNN